MSECKSKTLPWEKRVLPCICFPSFSEKKRTLSFEPCLLQIQSIAVAAVRSNHQNPNQGYNRQFQMPPPPFNSTLSSNMLLESSLPSFHIPLSSPKSSTLNPPILFPEEPPKFGFLNHPWLLLLLPPVHLSL